MKIHGGKQHPGKPTSPSESRQLRALVETLSDLLYEGKHSHHTTTRIEFVIDQMEKMAQRAEGGIHANPGPGSYRRKEENGKVYVGDKLTIRVGAALGYIEQLKYERTRKPTGFYFHDFGPGDALLMAEMLDGQRIIVVANVNGRPLWGEG